MAEAVIVGAEMAADRDGSVELLVCLRHPDGAEGRWSWTKKPAFA